MFFTLPTFEAQLVQYYENIMSPSQRDYLYRVEIVENPFIVIWPSIVNKDEYFTW